MSEPPFPPPLSPLHRVDKHVVLHGRLIIPLTQTPRNVEKTP